MKSPEVTGFKINCTTDAKSRKKSKKIISFAGPIQFFIFANNVSVTCLHMPFHASLLAYSEIRIIFRLATARKSLHSHHKIMYLHNIIASITFFSTRKWKIHFKIHVIVLWLLLVYKATWLHVKVQAQLCSETGKEKEISEKRNFQENKNH